MVVSGLEAGATIEYIPTIVVHSTSHVQEHYWEVVSSCDNADTIASFINVSRYQQA